MTTYEIVGSFYRPPAKALIAGISPGTKLMLKAEPNNQFDPNAIQVLLFTKDILHSDHEALNKELETSGKDIQDIMGADEWHLGFIRKELAKPLRESNIIKINKEYEGTFSIDFRGKPMVEIDL